MTRRALSARPYHVMLKRTPLLVRFHPLFYIRHGAAKKAKEAAAKAVEAAKAETDG
jgi:hypothetical protein